MNSLEQWRRVRHTGIRIGIILIVLAIAPACWGYAHGADGLGDLQVRLLRGGQPVANAAYTLEGGPWDVGQQGMIEGATDPDGMIIKRGIAIGPWRLTAPCLLVSVEVGEVSGQALREIDSTCMVYVAGVRNGN
jgi:hypothetical protein